MAGAGAFLLAVGRRSCLAVAAGLCLWFGGLVLWWAAPRALAGVLVVGCCGWLRRGRVCGGSLGATHWARLSFGLASVAPGRALVASRTWAVI